MPLAALRERSIRNDVRKLRFSRYSNTRKGLALALSSRTSSKSLSALNIALILTLIVKLERFRQDPTTEPIEPIRVTKAFTTHGIVAPLSHAIPVYVGIDTHAEVDLVDIQLVRQLGLKPCRNTNLPILRAINQQNLSTYRAYNLRLSLRMSMAPAELAYGRI